MMRTRKSVWAKVDWLTIVVYLLLVVAGWVNIYSTVYTEEQAGVFDFSQRYGKQLMWIIAAIVMAVLLIIVDSKFYLSTSYLLYFLSLILLLGVLLFGTEVKGAKSWFQIGGFAFQPAELAKMATALALARYMSTYTYKTSFSSYLIIAAIVGVPLLLILLQNDTGSALVFVVFALVLYREGLPGIFLIVGLVCTLIFIFSLIYPPAYTIIGISLLCILSYAIVRTKWMFMLKMLIFYIALFFAIWLLDNLIGLEISLTWISLTTSLIFILVCTIIAVRQRIQGTFWLFVAYFGFIGFTFSVDYVFTRILEVHQRARIENLLGLRPDPFGLGYNVNQSKIAIGSGGFSGKGFLNGTQTKFNFVPEQTTDFIFCTVGEEWGFRGTFLILGIFTLLLLRLVFLAERQRSTFSRVYGYSVACILFFHLAVNIGMTIGLAPVIGIPLPFFSYGGSSLWVFTMLLFIFIRLDASRGEKLSN